MTAPVPARLLPGRVLLVSRDAALAERVARALPGPLPLQPALELVCAPSLEYAAGLAGAWRLLLLDVEALRAVPAPETTAWAGNPLPVLWLGTAPLLAAGAPAAGCLPGPIVDYLDRRLPASKLAFILQQHLASRPGRPWRTPPAPAAAPPPGAVCAEINNLLTGLLGNAALTAEWAHSSSRRLPPPVAQRLQSIAELAGRMRDLLGALDCGHVAAR